MNRKSVVHFLMTVILAGMLLCGCGEVVLPVRGDLIASENGQTPKGIGIGSTYQEFIDAYKDYPIDTIDDNGTWHVFKIVTNKKDEEQTTPDTQYGIGVYFIDGQATTVEELNKDTDPGEKLLELSSAEYLSEHTVVYEFMIIGFENNEVTSMYTDSIDFNKELYQED